MSDNEGILSRWSRLKQEAKVPARAEEQPSAEADGAVADQPPADGSVVERSVGKEAVEPFDPKSLPPVDLIEATTDIRAFLTKGVPADLTKAALRRAWAADPAIRDFVGLSENAWDFNAPETIPGFGGPMPIEEARRVLAHMLQPAAKSEPADDTDVLAETLPPESEAEPAQTSGNTPQDAQHALVNTSDESERAVTGGVERQSATTKNNSQDVAVQNPNNCPETSKLTSHGRHGGALPK